MLQCRTVVQNPIDTSSYCQYGNTILVEWSSGHIPILVRQEWYKQTVNSCKWAGYFRTWILTTDELSVFSIQVRKYPDIQYSSTKISTAVMTETGSSYWMVTPKAGNDGNHINTGAVKFNGHYSSRNGNTILGLHAPWYKKQWYILLADDLQITCLQVVCRYENWRPWNSTVVL